MLSTMARGHGPSVVTPGARSASASSMDSGFWVMHNLPMEEPKAFRLRYIGARFAKHHLPVDVLFDLPAFRDLLVAYVKEAWRESHPGRVRLPRGFIRGLQFDLVGIEDGSAVPAIEWDSGSAQLQLPHMKDELTRLLDIASNQVGQLFERALIAGSGGSLTPVELNFLNRFGYSLKEDERIEFLDHHGADGNIVYLDAYRRKTLITQEEGTYPVRFDSVGRLLGSMIDASETGGRISVETKEHGTIQIPVSPSRAEIEFDGKMKNDVQFRLVIALDRNDAFAGVLDVLEVELIDDEVLVEMDRCRNRISALSSLLEGWHDGSGAAPTISAIAVANTLLDRSPDMAARYRIFPTDVGGVLFEFVQAGWSYSVEIGADGRAEIFGIENEGDGEMETGTLVFESEEFREKFEQVTEGRP